MNIRTDRASVKLVRILRIMEHLRQNQHGAGAIELAKLYGGHRTTIYRDIEVIAAAGVPIVL